MSNETTALHSRLTQFRLPWPYWENAPRLLLIAIAYFAAAKAAFFVGTLSDRIFAPFWPPNIVLLCAFVFTPPGRWWTIVLATFPPHFVTEVEVGMSLPQLLVAFATNIAVATISAGGLRRFAGPLPWFTNLRGTSWYIAITALASPALTAFGGAFVPILGGGALARYDTFWEQWYASNALGSLTLGSLALIAINEGQRFFRPATSARQFIEGILLGVGLVATCTIAFNVSAGNVTRAAIPSLVYSPLPLIIWATIRFGAKGASATALTITVVLTWLTLNGPSIFDTGNAEANAFALQTFLIGLSALVLFLGASIEEAKHTERLTRESEERMSFATAAANVGIWHYNRRDASFWMTDHCRAMLGIGDGETVTRNSVLKAIHPEDRDSAINALRSSNESGRTFTTEFRVILPDGKVHWYLASARADDEDGAQVSGIISEMTANKEAESEAALQRREIAHLMRVAMLGELSGGIAHELTQPLTAILSNAEAARNMLSKNRDKPGDLAEILDDIIHDEKRANEVIQRLRKLFRNDNTIFDTLDVNASVTEVLRLLRSELINRRVEVAVTATPRLPEVLGDAVQIQQVLLNLILNAVDAMSDIPVAQRRIEIRTARTNDGAIEVSIRDHGPGIAAGKSKQIFTPFFTTKQHGLGLGLSICQTIIKSHSGVLSLDNNPDVGATARFVVPVYSERAPAS